MISELCQLFDFKSSDRQEEGREQRQEQQLGLQHVTTTASSATNDNNNNYCQQYVFPATGTTNSPDVATALFNASTAAWSTTTAANTRTSTCCVIARDACYEFYQPVPRTTSPFCRWLVFPDDSISQHRRQQMQQQQVTTTPTALVCDYDYCQPTVSSVTSLSSDVSPPDVVAAAATGVSSATRQAQQSVIRTLFCICLFCCICLFFIFYLLFCTVLFSTIVGYACNLLKQL